MGDLAKIATLTPALWDAQLAVNLRAPALLAKAFAAHLPAGTNGNIINMIDQRESADTATGLAS